MGGSKDRDRKQFVQMEDGKIIEGTEVHLHMPFIGKPDIVVDRGNSISLKEVQAYQTINAYYRKIGKAFVPRIKKGPVNVYCSTSATAIYTPYAPSTLHTPSAGGSAASSVSIRYTYYIQKGDSAKIERLKPLLLQTYVKDYAPSAEVMSTYLAKAKKQKIWSWINTSSLFGGIIMAGALGVKNDNVTAFGYTGVGLLVGGLLNGIANKVFKAANYHRLEEAIDLYDIQLIKKKMK